MKFIELSIKTNTAGSEMLSGVLMGAGVTTFVIDDPNDLDEVMQNKEIPIDYVEDELLMRDRSVVTVKAYLAVNEQGLMQRDDIIAGTNQLKDEYASVFDIGTLEISQSEVDDSDWADNWKQFFHPLKIGKKFLIKPTWESCVPDGRHVLEIDPESSFGSGQHETTALCLEMLEELNLCGMTVLDMGCGSGILGIGCALLGAKKVLGVDIDKNAADIANKNAVINKVDGVFSAICGNVLANSETAKAVEANKYDIIAANIVADVLIAMADGFYRVANDGAVLICSGIIGQRKDEVVSALEKSGFTTEKVYIKNDWAAVKCIKTR